MSEQLPRGSPRIPARWPTGFMSLDRPSYTLWRYNATEKLQLRGAIGQIFAFEAPKMFQHCGGADEFWKKIGADVVHC
jgi:hypothetical protein